MSNWPPYIAIRPLQWTGPRSQPRYAPFRAKWSDTLLLLARELDAIAAPGKRSTQVLQVDIDERDFRLDGYPRANARQNSAAIIISLESKYGPLSYPCDAFTHWEDNVRAVALALEALRKVDRYGVTKRGEQYTGWKELGSGAIAVGSQMSESEARALLMRYVPELTSVPDSDEKLVRNARAYAHPDRRGGDRSAWDQVDEAARALGVAP